MEGCARKRQGKKHGRAKKNVRAKHRGQAGGRLTGIVGDLDTLLDLHAAVQHELAVSVRHGRASSQQGHTRRPLPRLPRSLSMRLPLPLDAPAAMTAVVAVTVAAVANAAGSAGVELDSAVGAGELHGASQDHTARALRQAPRREQRLPQQVDTAAKRHRRRQKVQLCARGTTRRHPPTRSDGSKREANRHSIKDR